MLLPPRIRSSVDSTSSTLTWDTLIGEWGGDFLSYLTFLYSHRSQLEQALNLAYTETILSPLSQQQSNVRAEPSHSSRRFNTVERYTWNGKTKTNNKTDRPPRGRCHIASRFSPIRRLLRRSLVHVRTSAPPSGMTLLDDVLPRVPRS